ncbi:MAG: YceH family protein [Roseibacillus sp.]|nr:YceH family protein [Roseibacillus sp.]
MQHFPEIQLTFEETRVLGCLLEKEILTPDTYPLSLNSLVTACNQSSSRYPITNLDASDILEALRSLSEKYLVEKVLGGRTSKYEHCLKHVLSLQDSERAVFTVLLLRGAQTTGEIRQRTDRIHRFTSLKEVEEILTWFIEYPHGPLVRRIPAEDGRRVEAFEHLLSERIASPQAEGAGQAPDADLTPEAPSPSAGPAPDDEEPEWKQSVESRLAKLEQEVISLRAHLNRREDTPDIPPPRR